MRIIDEDSDTKLDSIAIFLTRNELKQLIGYAKQLLENPSLDHHHLSSEDYKKEITICIYDPKNIKMFDERSQKLISEDE
ncbi:MAG: hypothetical protein K1X28_10470 [Parachlamydiales bacterium]|nr:hypothetical protein [Parachlamydiales bacterium]